MKLKTITYVISVIGISVSIFFLVILLISDYKVYSIFKTEPFEYVPHIKYVLKWTSKDGYPLSNMEHGQSTFIENNCSIQNCFVTYNRDILGDVSKFDVILFYGPEISKDVNIQLPGHRSPHQSYIYSSMESAAYYPVDKKFDDFFNQTWTFKLNSDLYCGYMIIRDRNGSVIGPKAGMNWMDINDMAPIDNNIKQKLANKKTAAAWFVSNCNVPSQRSQLALNITKELRKYDMDVDIYGVCGDKKCPRDSMDKCLEILQKDYYFYFAFENSFDEDYVTEKLLHALQNYAVPVVYGGADYSRFMPDRTYLNANELNITQLVNQMVDIIEDRNKYHNFFKWHNHYSYHSVQESPETNYYCEFCAFVNKEESWNNSRSLSNFSHWWNA